MRLKFDVNMICCMIDKQTSSIVHVILMRLAARCKQTTLSCADEMIDRDALTGEQMIGLQNAGAVLDRRSFLARRRSWRLLPKLTSCAFWWMAELRCCNMQAACRFASTQDAGSHQKLNLATVEVPQASMPA
jgi:hypothetical protein